MQPAGIQNHVRKPKISTERLHATIELKSMSSGNFHAHKRVMFQVNIILAYDLL